MGRVNASSSWSATCWRSRSPRISMEVRPLELLQGKSKTHVRRSSYSLTRVLREMRFETPKQGLGNPSVAKCADTNEAVGSRLTV